MKQENWEKEFKEQFPQLYSGYPEGTFAKRIEAFISDLLTTQKQEFERARNSGRTMFYEGRASLKAELRPNIIAGKNYYNPIGDEYNKGRHAAFDDVLSLLDQVK